MVGQVGGVEGGGVGVPGEEVWGGEAEEGGDVVEGLGVEEVGWLVV